MFKVKPDATAWSVISSDGTIVQSGLSNKDAWRLADRLSGEPISKKEDTSEWASRKID